MRRWRRVRAGCSIALVAAAALVVGLQVGWSPPERFTVRRTDGSPAAGAWVAFYYTGWRFNFVDSIEYERSGGVVRADGAGRVVLPGRLYRKAPFDGYAQPWIDLLYDPGSHYASQVGRHRVSPEGNLESLVDDQELVVTDRSDDPAAWNRSLENLYTLVSFELVFPLRSGRRPRIPVSREQLLALTGAVKDEYRALQERHGATPRAAPAPDAYFLSRPTAEQEEIRAWIRADLERDPLWGSFLERWWGDRLTDLERSVAELP